MKVAKLLHNPNAGDGEYSKETLVSLIENHGYKCLYSSTKEKGWKEIEPEVDFLVVAGGDGTVRKVATELLDRKVIDRNYPIAVLPLGTANNIGRTFGFEADEATVASWSEENIQKIDVGKVQGLPEDIFFIEGFGFGLFPNLMKEMKKRKDKEEHTSEENIINALDVLLELAKTYKARPCKLELDGVDHSGEFLLVEVMNIRSIGPNLDLNPMGDPSDGEFEVIIIPENQREKLVRYIEDKLADDETAFSFSALKASDIKIKWDGLHLHADDEILKADAPVKVEVAVQKNVLEFLVPDNEF
ncbi:diacylglycerol/lipid kinase family protein [Polluticoccus soli]|uniref:diacylglycerol/lipid kinase family protein n=1 Tax=Polluticoccus soli TaxID=3034150 RepID=UPI0023E0AEE4|nr:diacylglycerol kinase family protein [Flavipsychrobacter sp. JY13-12]